jgi:hypothetical protein
VVQSIEKIDIERNKMKRSAIVTHSFAMTIKAPMTPSRSVRNAPELTAAESSSLDFDIVAASWGRAQVWESGMEGRKE